MKGFFQVTFPNTRSLYIGKGLDVGNVTLHNLLVLIEKIITSQGDLDKRDIELTYTFSPRSFRVGGGGIVLLHSSTIYSVKPPPGVGEKNFKSNPTWTLWKYDGSPLCCAAVAIVYHMNRYNVKISSNFGRPSSQEWFCKKVVDFQTEMGWGSDISMAEFETFIQKYPTYKIFIFANYVKERAIKVYKGTDHTEDANNGRTKNPDNCIPLFFDERRGIGHFAYIKSIAQMFQDYGFTNPAFCWKCASRFTRGDEHSCIPTSKRRRFYCRLCGSLEHKQTECIMQVCKVCSTHKPREIAAACSHRCVLPKPLPEFKEFLHAGDDANGSQVALLCWDIESMFSTVAFRNDHIQQFERDENNRFTGNAIATAREIVRHIPNLVIVKNVYDSAESKVFYGDRCLQEFVAYVQTYNAGNNIMIAHNSGRYDTRLVLSAICREAGMEPSLITRGTNILCMDIVSSDKKRKVRFIDSFNFLPQSLASIASEMKFSSKGTFPIYFNTSENQDYIGPVPDISQYIVPRTSREYEELKAWHAEEVATTEVWSLKDKLIEYCQQDVDLLCKVVEQFDINCRKMCPEFTISPWMYITGPAFVHKAIMTYAWMDIEDRLENSTVDKGDKLAVGNYLSELAQSTVWACLLPAEYHFARKTLRGGRTDLKAVHYKLTDEDRAAGRIIRYADIVSSYPSQQLKHKYPVGTPTIHVYDELFFPSYDNDYTIDASKHKSHRDGMKIVESYGVWPSAQEMLGDETFFGFVCVTIHIPTDIFDPIVPVYDEKTLKCTFPCGLIEKAYITTNTLKIALRDGAEIIKMHRYDEYKAAPCVWSDFIFKCYLGKMKNSKNAPSPDEQQRLTQAYSERYGYDNLQFDQWCKNPAMKKVSKVLVNCGWGKHAQNMYNETVLLLDMNETENLDILADKIESVTRNEILLDVQSLGSEKLYVKSAPVVMNSKTNVFKDGSIVLAAMVTDYARIQLYEELRQLSPDKRQLYYDTDSIIYIYDPSKYNIPEGDILGDWERDDEDVANGGIVEFVALAPKTYGIKYANGKTSIKCKGVSLSEWTDSLLNFDTMVALVHSRMRGTAEQDPVQIPQFQFKYTMCQDLETYNYFKQVKFDDNLCKGTVSPVDMKHYPPGYDQNLIP